MRLIDIYKTATPDFGVCEYFLYELLRERKPYQNISHSKLPTYTNHCKFIESKPYKHWYIVENSDQGVGSVYITHKDEMGLFIKEEYTNKRYGTWSLEEVFKTHPDIKLFYANIAPTNSGSIAFFSNRGFKYHGKTEDVHTNKIKQYIYYKINSYYVEKMKTEKTEKTEMI